MNNLRLRKIAGKLFVVVSLVFIGYLLVQSTIVCSSTESSKVLVSPRGGKVPKYNPDRTFRSFANLSKACGYRGPNIYCPDIRGHGETVLRQLQLSVVRMLRIMDVISRRHNINFWLWRGTLLGAVRHGATIPWDNDADIAMLREDYDKFIKVAARDIPKDIFLQNDKTDPEFKLNRLNEAKLRDEVGCYGTCLRKGCRFHDGFQVDIFVLDQHKDGTLKDGFGRIKVLYDDVFPLEELYFEGYRMPVPRKSMKLLSNRYGEDFHRIPPYNHKCPPGNFIGIPWYSCKEIEHMNPMLKSTVLTEAFVANPVFLRVMWYFA